MNERFQDIDATYVQNLQKYMKQIYIHYWNQSIFLKVSN